jgi:hypothetical protein
MSVARSVAEVLAEHVTFEVESIDRLYLKLELRVGYDNAADYLQTLLEAVAEQAKVVLTSRTQHFRSAAQVRTALGDRVAAKGQPLRRQPDRRGGAVRPAQGCRRSARVVAQPADALVHRRPGQKSATRDPARARTDQRRRAVRGAG